MAHTIPHKDLGTGEGPLPPGKRSEWIHNDGESGRERLGEGGRFLPAGEDCLPGKLG